MRIDTECASPAGTFSFNTPLPPEQNAAPRTFGIREAFSFRPDSVPLVKQLAPRPSHRTPTPRQAYQETGREGIGRYTERQGQGRRGGTRGLEEFDRDCVVEVEKRM